MGADASTLDLSGRPLVTIGGHTVGVEKQLGEGNWRRGGHGGAGGGG